MLRLPNVTLLAVDTRNEKELTKTLKALLYSSREIKFAEIKLISHIPPKRLPDNIKWEFVDEFSGIDAWCNYIFYHLHKHVETDFCLLVHSDGFVVNPSNFNSSWLEYDYIGSPWPIYPPYYTTSEGEVIRVGNSVGLRSQKLLRLPSEINIPWEINADSNYHEDTMICVYKRSAFVDNGCKFAPVDVAKYFGKEIEIPENKDISNPFLFHKFFSPSHSNYKYRNLLKYLYWNKQGRSYLLNKLFLKS